MRGAAADLHRDNAGWKAFSETNDARWPRAPSLDGLALTIQPQEAAAVLAKINSEDCNLHPPSPRSRKLQSTITRLAEGVAGPIKVAVLLGLSYCSGTVKFSCGVADVGVLEVDPMGRWTATSTLAE